MLAVIGSKTHGSKYAMTDTTFYAVTLGYKSTLKTLRSGKAKLVIIAGNTPPLRMYLSESTRVYSSVMRGSIIPT